MGDTWYFSSAGKSVGPHTLEDIQQLIAAGKLGPNDQVCSDGQNWQTVSATPELQLVAASATLSLVGYQARSTGNAIVTQRCVDLLAQSSLWVRIMSIIMFIGTGLMFCGGVGMMILSAFLPSRPSEPPIGILGLIYIPLAILYLVPAIYLWRYSAKAKAFVNLRHENLLEEALQAQKSFWKFVVLLTFICFSLYILLLAGLFIAGAMTFHR